ncbi:MAG TPA: IS110 family transposase, partial [Verrucomicrobiae bacterium]|nr:IS110 family transposase [Verrucomicrobiae bacterium]
MTASLFAGIDLHSNNLMIGIVDQAGQRLKHQKLDCDLAQVVQFLKPFQPRFKSLAVESTYNWYWLVDGLRAHSFPVVLANPAQIEQYNGLKHADDKSDAYFLAELQRLGILPTGHIYDPSLRPVRDLLRRRLGLVRQRTALLLSFKSLYQRTTGQTLSLSRLKGMELAEAKTLYEHPANCLIAAVQKEHIEQLNQSIERIEKAVMKSAHELPCYQRLGTLPGMGRILSMTITMEAGEIQRFKAPGNLASDCRTVDSQRLSNGKKKGDNNGKCGNKYLAWAFVEAANFAKRYDEHCRKWFDRKAAKTSTVIATKALACKLA